MNIIVKTAGGKVIVRPDTTRERNNEDFYVPEFVDALSWSPVLFARISRAGRSVGRQFASRYFDFICYGLLVYPENLIDGSPEGFACASCLDHTSFLHLPDDAIPAKDAENGSFRVCLNGREIFTCPSCSPDTIADALVEATDRCMIRRGDIIAVELQPRQALADRTGCGCSVTGSCNGGSLLDFKIIF